MIPKVVRGDRMAGLLVYLAGPGRSNEHTEPHLVAGDAAMMAWHDDAELGRDSALSIARHLDRPRAAYGVEVAGGHVWHCSLSLRAEEGMLTDDKWGEVARDFVAAMEFDENHNGETATKAACRWVAVRHGLSGNGNDHVHLAVNLVREDGTKASVHSDFRRAQAAARALEVKHGLEPLESVQAERSTRGWNPAEREAQARARAQGKYERDQRTADRPGAGLLILVGSFDELAVDEGGASADEGDQVRCVDHPSALLSGFDQLERHRDAGGPAAGALGDPGPQPDGREGRLDRVRGP